MSWTAVVPLKTSGERKSRLAALLSAEERSALSVRMFHHVVDVLTQVPAIGRIIVLADECPADCDGDWMADGGRGLNPELEQARKLVARSEEHTSELQSLMRISYAVFCLKKKKK